MANTLVGLPNTRQARAMHVDGAVLFDRSGGHGACRPEVACFVTPGAGRRDPLRTAPRMSIRIFDIVLLIYRRSIMEEAMKNVDVKVTVDVRVDPVGVAVLFASLAAALFFLKKKVKQVEHTSA